jgi:hypothetical protein
VNRRLFLQRTAAFAGCSAVGLTGCAKKPIAAAVAGTPSLPFYDALGPITPIRADVDRIFRITVCLRPDFMIAGGTIETREFQSPQDMASLAQPVIINCTGYGARQLWSDESIVPVRGQIAWLIPQEGVHYGLYYKGVNVLGRRDGIVVQPNLGGEDEGWNDTNEKPDKAAAVAGVEVLQELYSRMEKMPKRRS